MNAEERKARANWELYDKRATWSVIDSRGLSKVLNVSLQTINNWKMRDILPEPENCKQLPAGNKNWYKISKIKAWLNNSDENIEHWLWIKRHIDSPTSKIKRLEWAGEVVRVGWDIYGVEKSLIPPVFEGDTERPPEHLLDP